VYLREKRCEDRWAFFEAKIVHEQKCLATSGLDISACVGTFDLVTLNFQTNKDQTLATLPHKLDPFASTLPPLPNPLHIQEVLFGICTLASEIVRLLGKFLELTYRISSYDGLRI
jgi:hypothetical protein